jgi:cell division transport system ATP-binding protein
MVYFCTEASTGLFTNSQLPMSALVVELKQVDVKQEAHGVLANVNLRISQGEFVYLIGKTGSGKSSLLKTLYGALPLTVGEGKVAGFDLKTLNRRTIPKLRRELGIVFQDFNLLMDRSVADNLHFVLQATDWKDPARREARIETLLAQVGLAGTGDKMPFALSGGEQQRLAIARALLNDPVLILADEPTGNLDPETSDEILQLLRMLAKQRNTAVLFATHDYRILEQFPARILRCFNQKVVNDEDIHL